MPNPLYRSRPGGFDIKPAGQAAARSINDFIYLSEGFSNSFLVVTAAGRVVINTGMGFEAPVHKRNFGRRGLWSNPLHLADARARRPCRWCGFLP
jgi:hypothetical protein